MIEAAAAEQGELILVILGPLTNVALACKLDPQLPSRGRSMGLSSNYLCILTNWICTKRTLSVGPQLVPSWSPGHLT